jgi:hypothetical protein
LYARPSAAAAWCAAVVKSETQWTADEHALMLEIDNWARELQLVTFRADGVEVDLAGSATLDSLLWDRSVLVVRVGSGSGMVVL